MTIFLRHEKLGKTNLRLRNLRPADREMIRAWRNLPQIAKYMYTDHQITSEEHEKWFRRVMREEPTSRYWIIMYDDVSIGLVNLYGINQQSRRSYWAFYIANSNMQGAGIGSLVEYLILNYAFDVVELNKVCCEVLEFNKAVIKLHKKFGFQEEGYYRQHIKKGDQFLDVVALAILRQEWYVRRPKMEERLGRLFDMIQYRDYMNQFSLSKSP